MGLQILAFAVSALIQMQQARAQKKREKKLKAQAEARADAAKGFSIPVEGQSTSLPVLYGRNVIGGVRVYHNTTNSFNLAYPTTNGSAYDNALSASVSGGKHEFLYIQQALCYGELNRVLYIEVDGRPWNDPKFRTIGDGEGSTKGKGGLRLHIYKKGGQADPLMTVNDGGRAASRFKNCAFLTGAFRLNRDDYNFSGVPDIRVYCEGTPISSIVKTGSDYSISSSKSYSNNPALCLLDYLINPVYGRGLTADTIDLKSFYDAALICSQVVRANMPKAGNLWNGTGSGEARDIYLYECNMPIDTTRPIRDNIEAILETMGLAELIWSAGKYKLSLKYPKVFNLGDNYSIDQVVEYTGPSGIDLYRNTITNNPNLPNTEIGWVRDVVSAYLTDDDLLRNNESSISWPNASERYNYAKVRFLNESENFVEDTASWPPKTGTVDGPALDRGVWASTGAYNQSDIVSFSSVRYQLLDGVNRVSSIAPNIDSNWIVYQDATVYNIFREEDSGLPLELDFFESGTTDYWHALAKAEQRVRTSRSSTLYKFSLSIAHTNLEPGDIIKVTSNVFNIPGELLRIEEVKITESQEIVIDAYKFDARTLAWNANDNEVVQPRNIFDLFLDQVTGLEFLTASNFTLSVGQLRWVRPNDNRVNLFIVKRTTTPLANVDSTTIWEEVGRTSATFFDLPALQGGSFTFTVVAANANGRQAPENNSIGSSWPLITVGIQPVVIADTTVAGASIFYRSNTQPVTPTGGVFDFDLLTLTTVPAGWSVIVPNGVETVWVSQARAEVQSGTGTDTTLTWSVPTVYQLPTALAYLTEPTVSVLQSFSTNDYTVANGTFKFIVGGVDLSESADVSYSIFSEADCQVTIDNTATVTKGDYQVTSIAKDTSTAILRATYQGVTFDVILSIVKLNIDYIKDITPPPDITTLTTTIGFTTLFVGLPAEPVYVAGHGHAFTRVYSAPWDGVSVLPTFVDATVLQEFTGTQTTISGVSATKVRLWFKNVSKDGYESDLPYGGTNGVAIEFGKVIGQYIENATILNAHIHDITADKILTGELGVAEEIHVGGKIKISGEGWIESYSTGNYSRSGDYTRLDSGNLYLYRYVPSLGQTFQYAYLKRNETGVADNNVLVTLPGYWKSQPKVMVSPFNLKFYDAAYSNQSQSINCQALDINETSPGSMIWTFNPVATLSLAANTGSTVLNSTVTNASDAALNSNMFTTPANSASITVNANLFSRRNTGASGMYYYRNVSWRVGYRVAGSGSAYTYTTSQVRAIGAITSGSVTDSKVVTFPSSNTWEVIVEYTSSNVSGNPTFGASSTEYATDTTATNTGTSAMAHSTSSTPSEVALPISYSPVSGWIITSITWHADLYWQYSTGWPPSSTGYSANNGTYELEFDTNTFGGSWYNDRLQTVATSSWNGEFRAAAVGGTGDEAWVQIRNAWAVISRQRTIPGDGATYNSQTIASYNFSLTAAQILATGSLNWNAIGD